MIRLLILIYGMFSIQVADGLKCYSCYDIMHPRFCNRIKECSFDEVCGIEKMVKLQETTYNIGCVRNSTCLHRRSSSETESCKSCCRTELCNLVGCGEHGYTSGHGPVCYNCQDAMMDECKHVTVCDNNEVCYADQQKIAGEIFYTTGCRNKHACQSKEGFENIFGRRNKERFVDKRSLQCTRCCDSTLCNSECGHYRSTTTLYVLNHTTKAPVTQGSTEQPTTISDTMGKVFYLAFLVSYRKTGNPYIYIVSNSTGTCQINIPFQSINTTIKVSKNDLNSFKIDSVIILEDHGIQQKAINVMCNISVSVYGVNFLGRENDGFLAIPAPYLGRDYIISSFKVLRRDPPKSNSNFGIIAIHDSTNVTITFRTTSGSVTYSNKQYNNNDVLQIQLNRMDTFYLSHDYDMSGTIISASKPVAVLSGLRTSYLRNGWGNHMSEMILPDDQLGHTFVVPTLYDSQCDFRILGQTQTAVRLYHKKRVTYVNIPTNRYLDYGDYTISTVNTSGHVQVQLFCNGLHSQFDAFMVTLPSLQHFKSNFQFPVVNNFPDSDPPVHYYITVIIQSNGINGLLLDNSPPHYNAVSNVTLNSEIYSVLSAEVSLGVHALTQQQEIPFGLIVYAHDMVAGYGYPAGLAVKNMS